MAVFLGNGHFLSSALAWLAVAIAATLWLTLTPANGGQKQGEAATLRLARTARNFALPGLLVAFLLCGAQPPGIYLRSAAWNFGYWALVAVAVVAATAFFSTETGDAPLRRRGFLCLVAVGLALKVYLLIASPAPVIDVFAMLQGGADALARGENPYVAAYPDPYRPGALIDTYLYPPLTLLVTAPFRWLFGDARAGLAACDVATFFLLLRLGAPRDAAPATERRERAGHDTARLCALLFLFHPRALFVLEQSWTEPIAALGFVAFLVATQSRRVLTAALCLGFFFASKQYLGLLAPLCGLGFWRLVRGSAPSLGRALARFAGHVGIALAVAAAVTLPLALWNWSAFVQDVWTFHWASPFREDALNLSALLFQAFGVRVPEVIAVGAATAAAAAGLWAAARRPTPAGLAAGAALTLLLALQLQKHAFCNYYHLVGILLLAAATASLGDERGGEREDEREHHGARLHRPEQRNNGDGPTRSGEAKGDSGAQLSAG